jgi:hypothetical protein
MVYIFLKPCFFIFMMYVQICWLSENVTIFHPFHSHELNLRVFKAEQLTRVVKIDTSIKEINFNRYFSMQVSIFTIPTIYRYYGFSYFLSYENNSCHNRPMSLSVGFFFISDWILNIVCLIKRQLGGRVLIVSTSQIVIETLPSRIDIFIIETFEHVKDV